MKFSTLAIVALLIDGSNTSLLQKETSCPGNNCGAIATNVVVTATPTVVAPACPAAAAAAAPVAAAAPAEGPVGDKETEEVEDSIAREKTKADKKADMEAGKKEIHHAIKSAIKELANPSD